MGAVPIALGALSSVASTASSFSGGGSYNTKSMEKVSLEQVAYLESRQQQKEALTLQMMETARNFANANFDSELSQLDLLRQQQEVQVKQQKILADYTYRNTIDTLDNEAYLKQVTNSYEDFQKVQAYEASKFSRQQGIDSRNIQLGYADRVRGLDKLQGEAQFDLRESGRGLEKTNAKGSSNLGRTQKLINLEQQSDDLDAQESELNLAGISARQSGDAQAVQANMSLSGDLGQLSDASKQALSEASKRMISRGNSSSDRINYYTDQKMNELLEAKERATINNAVSTGLIDSSTGVALAGIQSSRANLITRRQAILSDKNIDESNRAVALAQLDAEQKLSSLSERLQYLTLPFAKNTVSSIYDRTMNDLANRSDAYAQQVEDNAYNAELGYSNIMRNEESNQFNQAALLAKSQYDQALSDADYTSKLIGKNYDLGKYAAEQNKISTSGASDMQQASYLAQQRAALSAALSSVQTGMLSSGGGGGTNWGSGISNLLGGLSSIWNSTKSYNSQSNYLNRMSNLQSGTSGTSFSSPSSSGTWNSGTTGKW